MTSRSPTLNLFGAILCLGVIVHRSGLPLYESNISAPRFASRAPEAFRRLCLTAFWLLGALPRTARRRLPRASQTLKLPFSSESSSRRPPNHQKVFLVRGPYSPGLRDRPTRRPEDVAFSEFRFLSAPEQYPLGWEDGGADKDQD